MLRGTDGFLTQTWGHSRSVPSGGPPSEPPIPDGLPVFPLRPRTFLFLEVAVS